MESTLLKEDAQGSGVLKILILARGEVMATEGLFVALGGAGK